MRGSEFQTGNGHHTPDDHPFRVLVSEPIDPAGFASLHEVASVDIRPDLTPMQLLLEIGHYHALMVRSQTKVTAEVLNAGTRLLIVGRAGVGVDNIDVPAATREGIVVVNSPGGNTIAAAEHTLGLIFALARQIPAADASVKRDEWKRSAFMGTELFGKTLGIVGLGRIGSHVAMVARALGMRVIAFDPHAVREDATDLGVELVAIETVLAGADYLTLHAPKTPETNRLLDAASLARTKPGVRIINVARGGLIDEDALADAIRTGRVAGAALDVYDGEPQVRESLRTLGDRVVLTPHLGASTTEAQLNVAKDVATQIARVLGGQPATSAVAIDRPGKAIVPVAANPAPVEIS
ncbi:D-3-phosphoglycerate dehydrogenase [compost metagenome]